MPTFTDIEQSFVCLPMESVVGNMHLVHSPWNIYMVWKRNRQSWHHPLCSQQSTSTSALQLPRPNRVHSAAHSSSVWVHSDAHSSSVWVHSAAHSSSVWVHSEAYSRDPAHPSTTVTRDINRLFKRQNPHKAARQLSLCLTDIFNTSLESSTISPGAQHLMTTDRSHRPLW